MNPPDLRTRFIVLAEYQLYGEMDDGSGVINAHAHMNELFELAVDHNDILSGVVVHVSEGIWGLQLVTFEVELLSPFYTKPKDLKKKIKKRLCRMVNDSDVDVRWIHRPAQYA